MSHTIQSDKGKKWISCVAALTTAIAGVIHLSFVHPLHGQLQEFGIFFLVAGVSQVFWIIPVVRKWNKTWHYIGIGGTSTLIVLWVLSRATNLISPRAFPVNQMSILEESMQVAFIALLVIITLYNSKTSHPDTSGTGNKKSRIGIIILIGLVVALILIGLFVPIQFGGPMGHPPVPGGPPGQLKPPP